MCSLCNLNQKVIPWSHNSTLALYSTICRLLTCWIWLFVGCRNLNGTLFLFTYFPILRCTNLGSGLSLLVWMVLNGPVMVARCLGMVKAFWRMFQGLPMYCFFASMYSFFCLVLDICQYLESFWSMRWLLWSMTNCLQACISGRSLASGIELYFIVSSDHTLYTVEVPSKWYT